MAHVTYKIVRHEDGWAYTVDGVFSESFATHARPSRQRNAPRVSSGFRGGRSRSSTKTRRANGTSSVRSAAIVPTPMSWTSLENKSWLTAHGK